MGPFPEASGPGATGRCRVLRADAAKRAPRRGASHPLAAGGGARRGATTARGTGRVGADGASGADRRRRAAGPRRHERGTTDHQRLLRRGAADAWVGDVKVDKEPRGLVKNGDEMMNG